LGAAVTAPRPDELGRCRACRRQVFWAVTTKGGRMPLDPDPHEHGNVAAYRTGTGGWRCRVLRADEDPAGFERRYMPHFATCHALPSSAKWLPAGVASLPAARARRNRE
jgi:hypothetical protein